MTGFNFSLYAEAYQKWFGETLASPAIGMPSMYSSK